MAIARALVTQPRIVLADEPTANLDRKNAELFLETLLAMQARAGTTLLIASHDPLVQQYMPQVLQMEDGLCLA